ncbi:Protein phosphatase Slingshot -like protein 1 [Trichinella pseudospiralis]|uniref:protein-serine/threonine phosphatase n=1 Tax=Trichinella pseudospiralis TaxID=6337 RepID=A0A0V1FZW7_TRIPS|nr:Protein phosphatase Slingshot -like protein 1 [Trichinella pseudospiralis]
MSLLTVQRSPTPSSTIELIQDDGNDGRHLLSETTVSSHDIQSYGGSQSSFSHAVSAFRYSECYFAVRGAAVILPKHECMMPVQSNSIEGGGREIQQHLQTMLQLLRSQDTLKMAVKLSSLIGKNTRYLAIVSTVGRQDNQESVVIGIDCGPDQNPTIGLVLPIWASTKISLDSDGGICIESDHCQHVFKPISVQAMWSVYQSLHKVHAVALNYPYYPGGLTHTWVQYYESHVCSPEPYRSEWHYLYQDDCDLKVSTLERFKDKPPERTAAEKLIRDVLKNIMQSVDLDEVTSKDIRNKLEERLELNLKEYKDFIDQEMLVILGQMDKPSKIFPYLYLGTEWNASNWDELIHNNVGFILNVTREVDNFFPGMFHYLKISISDDESTELLKFWDETFKFIAKAKEINQCVLVHCKKGISRSASTVIAYAMKEYGMPVEEALNYVKDKRNCITPNRGFMEQLKIYQGILDARQVRNRLNLLWNHLPVENVQSEVNLWGEDGGEYAQDQPNVDSYAKNIICSKSDDDEVEEELDCSVGGGSPLLLAASENILKASLDSYAAGKKSHQLGVVVRGSKEVNFQSAAAAAAADRHSHLFLRNSGRRSVQDEAFGSMQLVNFVDELMTNSSENDDQQLVLPGDGETGVGDCPTATADHQLTVKSTSCGGIVQRTARLYEPSGLQASSSVQCNVNGRLRLVVPRCGNGRSLQAVCQRDKRSLTQFWESVFQEASPTAERSLLANGANWRHACDSAAAPKRRPSSEPFCGRVEQRNGTGPDQQQQQQKQQLCLANNSSSDGSVRRLASALELRQLAAAGGTLSGSNGRRLCCMDAEPKSNGEESALVRSLVGVFESSVKSKKRNSTSADHSAYAHLNSYKHLSFPP